MRISDLISDVCSSDLNLLNHTQRKVTDRIMAYALYIDPPLGRCGMTEKEIRQAGYKALVAKRPMTQVKRADMKGDSVGFIKVFVDADSQKIRTEGLRGGKGGYRRSSTRGWT